MRQPTRVCHRHRYCRHTASFVRPPSKNSPIDKLKASCGRACNTRHGFHETPVRPCSGLPTCGIAYHRRSRRGMIPQPKNAARGRGTSRRTRGPAYTRRGGARAPARGASASPPRETPAGHTLHVCPVDVTAIWRRGGPACVASGPSTLNRVARAPAQEIGNGEDSARRRRSGGVAPTRRGAAAASTPGWGGRRTPALPPPGRKSRELNHSAPFHDGVAHHRIKECCGRQWGPLSCPPRRPHDGTPPRHASRRCTPDPPP